MNERARLAVVGLLVTLLAWQAPVFGRNRTIEERASGRSTFHSVVRLSNASEPGPYAPRHDHPWNRLYNHFYIRTAQNGRQYGDDELDPLLWSETKYLLEGQSYQQSIALLDDFLSTHAEKLITSTLKRAMLQRDLWAVFDWLSSRDGDHSVQRLNLEVRLARIIRRLALNGRQIDLLPTNYGDAIAAGIFPTQYDPEHHDRSFLPPDLFQSGGPWVCLSNLRGGPAAPSHAQFFNDRSTFLIFFRMPEGREAALAYLEKLREFPKPWILNPDSSSDPSPLVSNPELPQFPPGTEVTLVRQLLVIDDRGRLTPTHLTESVQTQVYKSIPSGTEINSKRASASQDVYEFVLSRYKLFTGVAGGLRPVARDEKDFAFFMAQGIDWFEQPRTSRSPEGFQQQVLNSCSACHAAPGVHSLLSYSRRRFSGQSIRPPELIESNPANEVSNTIREKIKRYDWGLIRGLWQERR